MSSFGEGLKREREKKKITLDQVSVSTKISVRMLRALEEEKFDQLPGGIFNKGFVRAYARHLGLDEEQMIENYLAVSAPVSSNPPDDLELRAMAEQKDKERHRQARLAKDFPWGWVATVLLLLALGFSIWGARSGRDAQGQRAVIPEPAAIHVDKSVTASPVPSAAPQSLPAEAQVNKEAQVNTNAQGAAPQYTPTAAPEKPMAPPPPAMPGTFTVHVVAEDDSWLSITADGKTVFTGTLTAPGEQSVRAHDSIVIRAGNLGGLGIDFDGKALPSQGDYGEAKTLTFDSSGLKPSPKQDNP